MEDIGKESFVQCEQLDNVTILSEVSIGENAFSNCIELNRVVYTPDEKPTCEGEKVFSQTDKLEYVTVNQKYTKEEGLCGKDVGG